MFRRRANKRPLRSKVVVNYQKLRHSYRMRPERHGFLRHRSRCRALTGVQFKRITRACAIQFRMCDVEQRALYPTRIVHYADIFGIECGEFLRVIQRQQQIAEVFTLRRKLSGKRKTQPVPCRTGNYRFGDRT